MVARGCGRKWPCDSGWGLGTASLASGWFDDSVAKKAQSIMISVGASLEV